MTDKKKVKKKVRSSFEVSRAKLVRFYAKAERNNHDIDKLFGAFISEYVSGSNTWSSLRL